MTNFSLLIGHIIRIAKRTVLEPTSLPIMDVCPTLRDKYHSLPISEKHELLKYKIEGANVFAFWTFP